MDLLQLHIPAGLDHSSTHSQGAAPPYPSAKVQPSLSHATPADYEPQGPARPVSAAHHQTEQVPLHPLASGGTPPPQQHGNNDVGLPVLPDHAADATAPGAACPQVQFGVFTNLASGSAFMGPSKMSAAARKAMSSFASDHPAAAPAIQKAVGGPSGSWQQATCFARPGARAADGTRLMQGIGDKLALKNLCHAHQQPLPGRQPQSTAQPASCVPAADPAEVVNPAVMKAADAAGPTATSTAGRTVTETSGPTVMHAATLLAAATAAAEPCGNSGAAGGCPSVQFGVFTNLRSGGMWAPPGKLSEKAKQRANEVFPDGALEVPAAASAAPAAAVAAIKQPAQQQPAGLQPAEAAQALAHTTGQLCSGMLCQSSCHGRKSGRNLMFPNGMMINKLNELFSH